MDDANVPANCRAFPQNSRLNIVPAFMNLLQFGNRLLDTSDVVFAEREDDVTKILLRGGHEVKLDGEVGNVVWSRLSGRLLDQMPQPEPAG